MKKSLFFISFLIISLNFLQAQEQETIEIPEIITYLDNENPVVEQRQVYTAEDLDELKELDLPTLLETAGIQLLSYGSYGLEQKPSIRGFTDETVRVIIDGICVNSAQYGTFDFSTLCIDDIERIEIVRGGFTEGVSDEDAVGGAIYITTKKQQFGTHFKSDTSISSYFNKNYPLDTVSQKLGFNTNIGNSYLKANGAFTFANNKYLYKDYDDETAQRENARVYDGSANVNYLKYFKDGSSLDFTDLFYKGNKQTPGSESQQNYGLQTDCNNNITIQLINPEVADAFKLENNLSWLSNYRTYDDSFGNSVHQIQTLRYNFTQNVYKYRQIKQDFGISADYTYLNSSNDGIHQQISGAFKSTTKIFWNLDKNSVDQNGENSEDLQTETEDVQSSTGLHENAFSSKKISISLPWAIKFCGNNFAFTPKVGVGLNTNNASIFIDFYKMTQFPNMDDLYWEDETYHGNPDLIPETGIGGEISVSSKSSYIPFSLCIFSNYYKNKIQWAGNTPQNVASAFYLGTDLKIEKKLLDNRLSISSNSEYLYTRLLDKSNKVTYGKKIMYTPDLVSSLTVKYKPDEKTTLITELNYTGKRYKSNVNASYLKPYLLVNVTAQTSFEAKNQLKFVPYIKVNNLLNWSYESIPDYPMPGINASAGLEITL